MTFALGLILGAAGLFVLEAIGAIVIYVVWLRRSMRRDRPPAYEIITPDRAAQARTVVDDFLKLPVPEPRSPRSSLTTDPTDPRLGHGVDDTPRPQQEAYLVLSPAERARGQVRPVRTSYVHARTLDDVAACGTRTTMSREIAETYARDPKFYGSTYCVGCRMHLPVAAFLWDGTNEPVGS